MRPGDEDGELRELFRAQRQSEWGQTPSFDRIRNLARLPQSRRRSPRPLLLAGAVAVGLALWLVLRRGGPSELELARSTIAWKSPTAFLLRSSTTSWFGSILRIDAAIPGSPLRALDPGGALGPPLVRSPRS
jgi:hypothetical protein